MNPSITLINKKFDWKSKNYPCPECGIPVHAEADIRTEIREIPCSYC
jgi:DNA-directed RNA polymerase subunit RPC12/RpoP